MYRHDRQYYGAWDGPEYYLPVKNGWEDGDGDPVEEFKFVSLNKWIEQEVEKMTKEQKILGNRMDFIVELERFQAENK